MMGRHRRMMGRGRNMMGRDRSMMGRGRSMMGRGKSMMGRGRSCHGGKMQEPPAGKSHEARDRTMDLSERRDGHAVGISNFLPPQRSPGADADPVLVPWGLPSPTSVPGVHWVSWSLAISPVTLGGTRHGFILLTTKAASLQSA